MEIGEEPLTLRGVLEDKREGVMKQKTERRLLRLLMCVPGGTRTPDLMFRRHSLYPLSYRHTNLCASIMKGFEGIVKAKLVFFHRF